MTSDSRRIHTGSGERFVGSILGRHMKSPVVSGDPQVKRERAGCQDHHAGADNEEGAGFVVASFATWIRVEVTNCRRYLFGLTLLFRYSTSLDFFQMGQRPVFRSSGLGRRS